MAERAAIILDDPRHTGLLALPESTGRCGDIARFVPMLQSPKYMGRRSGSRLNISNSRSDHEHVVGIEALSLDEI